MSDKICYEIESKNLQKLLKKLDAVVREDVIIKSLWQAALEIKSWSQEYRFVGAVSRFSPPRPDILTIRTGRLRASIGAEKTIHTGNIYFSRIGTNIGDAKIRDVYYGAFHEFGTRFIKPRPFLKPALENEENQQKVLTILTKNINEALKRE